ncbi:hypothetical protein RHMOL_Rhmol06G0085700 [Rhododendron molle]|uniref:Uncharacterized protein n=1 Tax=Rhododendron molle TaxID=49168 RepID=A0ACC0NBD0_RHOML|nr:hypothetical protein RHMOL_Rhmol06G0085700 [Rhododendron molle]
MAGASCTGFALLKDEPDATIKLLHCDLEVTGSSRENSLSTCRDALVHPQEPKAAAEVERNYSERACSSTMHQEGFDKEKLKLKLISGMDQDVGFMNHWPINCLNEIINHPISPQIVDVSKTEFNGIFISRQKHLEFLWQFFFYPPNFVFQSKL